MSYVTRLKQFYTTCNMSEIYSKQYFVFYLYVFALKILLTKNHQEKTYKLIFHSITYYSFYKQGNHYPRFD